MRWCQCERSWLRWAGLAARPEGLTPPRSRGTLHSMRRNRLFVPQQLLDVWLSEERVEVQGEVMITRPEAQRFQLLTAVLFKAEVTGTPDAHDLVGKVKDVEQLAVMGAEHYAESVILGDNAYECVEGFTGTPAEAESVPTGSSLADATMAALGEPASTGEMDLLARFLQSS